MQQYAAEDLVFFVESIFNEKTGWRYQAYEPIESRSRARNGHFAQMAISRTRTRLNPLQPTAQPQCRANEALEWPK
jgi:hypothetical protein